MELAWREFVGLMTAVLVLAGLSVVIGRGQETALILAAGGNSFAQVINAATKPAR